MAGDSAGSEQEQETEGAKSMSERMQIAGEVHLLEQLIRTTAACNSIDEVLDVAMAVLGDGGAWSAAETWIRSASGAPMRRGPTWTSGQQDEVHRDHAGEASAESISAAAQRIVASSLEKEAIYWVEWPSGIASDPARGTLVVIPVRVSATEQAAVCFHALETRTRDPLVVQILGVAAAQLEGVLARIQASDVARQRDDSFRAASANLAAVASARAEALRDSEERFRSAFEAAALGFALVGIDGHWLKVNRALCDLFGYSESDLFGLTFQDLTHPDDLEADLEQVRAVLEGRIQSYQMEKRYFHRDGRVVWALLSVSVVRDVAGEPMYFTAQVQDITRARQATTELTRSEARFRQLFEANGVMQWLIDPEAMCIVDANEAATRFYGYSLEQLRKMPLSAINALPEMEIYDASPQGGVPNAPGRVVPHRLASGEVRLIELHPTALDVDGRRLQHTIIFDVTERTRIANALEESEHRMSRIVDAQNGVATAGRDVDVVMSYVVRYAGEITNAAGALIELREGDEMVYRAVAGDAAPHRGLRLKVASSLSGACVLSGELIRCDDTETHPGVDLEACRRLGIRSMVLVPLASDGRPVGVLKVYSSEPRHFGEGDVQALQLLANAIDASIANAAAFEAGQKLLAERTEALSAIRDSEARFRDILGTVRSAAVCLDIAGRLTYCNDALLDLTGWTREEALGADWFEMFIPHGSIAAKAFAEHILAGTIPAHMENDILTVTGERRLMSWDNTVLRGSSGEVVGTASLGRDVTELRTAEHARERLTAILDAAPDPVAMVTADDRVPYLNRAARALLGIADGELAAGRLGALDPRTARDRVAGEPMRVAVRQGSWSGELTLRSAGGAELPVSQVILAHRDADGALEYFSTIIRDVTERKSAEAELRALSLVDDLTGLHNRRGFMTLSDQYLRLAHRSSEISLLLYFDLNAFKGINDSHGHSEGDAALRRVADVLRMTFRGSDILGRLGGDEFVVLATNSGEREAELRDRLQYHLDAANKAAGTPYQISLAVGVARIEAGAGTIEEVLAKADAALYREKRANPVLRAS